MYNVLMCYVCSLGLKLSCRIIMRSYNCKSKAWSGLSLPIQKHQDEGLNGSGCIEIVSSVPKRVKKPAVFAGISGCTILQAQSLQCPVLH